MKLKPGLIKYKVEFGSKTGGRETVLHTVTNLVCGDAYLIDGQSNARGDGFGRGVSRPSAANGFAPSAACRATRKACDCGATRSIEAAMRRSCRLVIGAWNSRRRLVENHKIPICIINGAVGGTRIDQHQRNAADPEDMTTIYGRLLWRVRQAKLTHGIRGILWHQGENDQGADGPTGGFGWETYRQYFIDLAAAWKQDYPEYPALLRLSDLAEVLRDGHRRLGQPTARSAANAAAAFSNMSIMSTLGIEPPGGCHYPAAGYAEFARLICPLVERDNYGKIFTTSITPPNLKRAYYSQRQERRDRAGVRSTREVGQCAWRASSTSMAKEAKSPRAPSPGTSSRLN